MSEKDKLKRENIIEYEKKKNKEKIFEENKQKRKQYV